MPFVDSDVTGSISGSGVDLPGVGAVAFRGKGAAAGATPDEDRITRDDKKGRIVNIAPVAPPKNFTAGSIFERTSSLLRPTMNSGLKLTFAKPEIKGKEIEIAAAFVEHVARDRGKTRPVVRISRGADRQQNEEADERNGVVLDGERTNAIRKLCAADLRKLKSGIRAERRQTGAVDRHQATTTGCEPPSAMSTLSLGTTLSTTRASGRSHSRAARCMSAGVTCRYRSRSLSKNPGSPTYRL